MKSQARTRVVQDGETPLSLQPDSIVCFVHFTPIQIYEGGFLLRRHGHECACLRLRPSSMNTLDVHEAQQ